MTKPCKFTFSQKSKQSQAAKPKIKSIPAHSDSAKEMRLKCLDFAEKHRLILPAYLDFIKKPVSQYFGAEDTLQVVICFYLKSYHADRIVFWHTKNEGKETTVGKAKKAYMGVEKGVSDLQLTAEGLPSFFMELKVKPNKPTPEQIAFIDKQIEFGNVAGVFYELDECVLAVLDWLSDSGAVER